jgi:hypothetical protein
MPRFYLDVMVGQNVIRDQVGQEFDSEEAAFSEATLLAHELAHGPRDAGHENWTEWRVIVRSGHGEVARAEFALLPAAQE